VVAGVVVASVVVAGVVAGVVAVSGVVAGVVVASGVVAGVVVVSVAGASGVAAGVSSGVVAVGVADGSVSSEGVEVSAVGFVAADAGSVAAGCGAAATWVLSVPLYAAAGLRSGSEETVWSPGWASAVEPVRGGTVTRTLPSVPCDRPRASAALGEMRTRMSDWPSIRPVTVAVTDFPVSWFWMVICDPGGKEFDSTFRPPSKVESPLWRAAFPSQNPAAEARRGTRSSDRTIHLFIRGYSLLS
jgi:hypothetical protein